MEQSHHRIGGGRGSHRGHFFFKATGKTELSWELSLSQCRNGRGRKGKGGAPRGRSTHSYDEVEIMEEKVATGDVTERVGTIGSHTEAGSA